jgi:hypothetical protein
MGQFADRLRAIQRAHLGDVSPSRVLINDPSSTSLHLGQTITKAMVEDMLRALETGQTEETLLASAPYAMAYAFTAVLYCTGRGPALAERLIDEFAETVRALGAGDYNSTRS